MTKKLIMITGATSGFGFEIAKIFNKHNFPLLLFGRDFSKIKNYSWNKKVIFAKSDVCDSTKIKKEISNAEKKYGYVDCLVNNAGIMILDDLLNQTNDECKKMIETNYLGLIINTKLIIEKMKKNNHGTIINISSIAGVKGIANHSVYCGTKWAVIGFSETLRQELAKYNVRISLVCPGAFNTNLLSSCRNKEILINRKKWSDTLGNGFDNIKVVAKSIFYIYKQPQDINIRQIVLAPTKQII